MGEEKSNKRKPKKRKRSGAYSRRKGHNYELQIIKELTDCGYPGLVSSRSESKRLDDAKIDIADLENVMPFYVQCKKTKNTPSIQKLNEEVGLKDKPLAIFWAKQENREVNMVTSGEYVIIPKEFFYTLIKNDMALKELVNKLTKIKEEKDGKQS